MQDFQISKILVSAINTADTEFRITRADDDSSALAASMASVGLCVPPLICSKDEGFIMVSGFKRLAVAATLGWKTITCRVAAGGSEKDLAKLAVAENAFQRELSPGEVIRAIALLNLYMDAKEMAEASPAIFNTKLNAGYIKNLTRIRKLPHPAMALLDTGGLSVKAAKTMVGLDPEAAKAFLDLFANVKVSSSKQMEIMTWAREICAREKISVSELFMEKEVTDILKPDEKSDNSPAHRDLSAAGNLLRAKLFQRRFPKLDLAKKSSAKQFRALKLPKGVRMVLPENFESMVYSISFNFKSPKELQDQLTGLNTLPDSEGFKDLLKR